MRAAQSGQLHVGPCVSSISTTECCRGILPPECSCLCLFSREDITRVTISTSILDTIFRKSDVEYVSTQCSYGNSDGFHENSVIHQHLSVITVM